MEKSEMCIKVWFYKLNNFVLYNKIPILPCARVISNCHINSWFANWEYENLWSVTKNHELPCHGLKWHDRDINKCHEKSWTAMKSQEKSWSKCHKMLWKAMKGQEIWLTFLEKSWIVKKSHELLWKVMKKKKKPILPRLAINKKNQKQGNQD